MTWIVILTGCTGEVTAFGPFPDGASADAYRYSIDLEDFEDAEVHELKAPTKQGSRRDRR